MCELTVHSVVHNCLCERENKKWSKKENDGRDSYFCTDSASYTKLFYFSDPTVIIQALKAP